MSDGSLILNVAEEDGLPSTYPYKLKFPNGVLVDNGDGSVSISCALDSSVLKKDGSVELTGNWTIGTGKMIIGQIARYQIFTYFV
jgi:hypothetical protein